MAAFKIIDTQLYAGNGGGGYSGVKWCDLQSATIECKCNEADREKFKQMLLGENHYKEKPRIDIPSKENITDYIYTLLSSYIYTLLSSYNQDLSEFEVSVICYKNPIENRLKLTISLANYAYQTKNEVSMIFLEYDTQEEIQAAINTNLNALVRKCLGDINKTKSKINMKKENETMAQYTCGKMEVIKTQEEIELEEKLAKLRAEYDKKAAKLREEYKVAKEKKERDAKAKELHDKYQSLIDSGFNAEQAYDILKTKLGEFAF